MRVYQDPVTGYEITQYAHGPERNAKLYFTTENFSADDRYFFFNKDGNTMYRSNAEQGESPAKAEEPGLYRANVETGELKRMASDDYMGFAMHWNENWGVLCRKDGMVCRLDCETGEITELGALPEGGHVTGHLTVSNNGRVACAYQLANKIYALLILDPGENNARVVYRTDQWIGHAQICPTDANLLFFIHETGGDALQRTWMYDVEYRMARPYYVEHPDEWITHETWSADGSHMALMKIPHQIVFGDKDGRHFDVVYDDTPHRALHPGLSRDMKWLCCDGDRLLSDGKRQSHVLIINPKNGKSTELATTYPCKTGSDHHHPSFNRAGNKILFSAPDENGIAQVCVIDLRQVKMP